MSTVTAKITISLDGYVAGPNQSLENPLGEGGEQIHTWMFKTEAWWRQQGREGGKPGPDSDIVERMFEGVGAVIMGRNMFGGGPGGWDDSWRGWWGDNPPYHVPVFVLTHHPREPVPMEGGTTFHFVTDGVESALEQARAAAGDRRVLIMGGANAIGQFLTAGLVDQLQLHLSPILLGAGERLFDNVTGVELELVETIPSNAVTHLTYRVVR